MPLADVQWGDYEGSGNRMRVGIAVTWTERDGTGPVVHGSAGAKATVEYWTQNQQTWSDDQKLNFGGAIDGSVSFHNGQGDGVQTKRDEKSYIYTYGDHEYGSSPGDRTFSASLTGAYNGITPSKSVTKSIPARPYGAPAEPTNTSVSRVSDSTQRVTWNNHSTSGEPYDELVVEKKVFPGPNFAGGDWWVVARTGGGATNYNDSSTIANRQYGYRVKSKNNIGASSYDYSGAIYTTPADPGTPSRTTNGTTQELLWVNNVKYDEYETQIQHAVNGSWGTIVDKTAGSTTHNWTNCAVTDTHQFRIRAKTTVGTVLYSDWVYSSVSEGTTSAPNAPTGLLPAAGTVINPTVPLVLRWTHNSTDGSAQRKYQLQHRLVGAGSWTTLNEVTSIWSQHTLPANTYGYSTYTSTVNVEWQVKTWGTDATASSFSSSGTFSTALETPVKYPLFLDPSTGQVEAKNRPTVPIGSVVMWVASSAPTDWLLCQGQSLLRSSYPALFNIIGTTYGSVDGTHFNLPTLYGRVPVGAGILAPSFTAVVLGDYGGADEQELAIANLPPHSHGMTHTHSLNRRASAGTTGGVAMGAGTAQADVDTSGATQGTTGDGQGTSDPVPTIPPYCVVNFIIKAL